MLATQPHSHIATAAAPLWRRPQAASFVAMQLCGYVALWLCSYVAMWLCGYVAMWLCGYVDKFQICKFLNFKDSRRWLHTCSNIFEFFECQIRKDNIFQDVPIYFLIFFEVFWYKQNHNYRVHGPEMTIKRSKIQ